MGLKTIKALDGRAYSLPIFFPDATRAVVRSVDSLDLESTKTPGVLVNTFHLLDSPGIETIEKFSGVAGFMNWNGATVSDSGGFQVMSLAKHQSRNAVTDEGVTFRYNGVKTLLTPERSIQTQIALKTDIMVVLDDFTPHDATYEEAKDTVSRTILWAARCRKEFERLTDPNHKPYLIAVAQGGKFPDLRKKCIEELVKIGFDGMGYGGWPIDEKGKFDTKTAKLIADNTPKDYLLYGLGVGKPKDIVACVKLGYTIFDCVLPTRDARHARLYIFDCDSIEKIDLTKRDFYKYIDPSKQIYADDKNPTSNACDCLLCANYTLSYLCHLFKIKDALAWRLATIHNLRFYSILMERLGM